MSKSGNLRAPFPNSATDLPPSYAAATATAENSDQGLISVDFLPNLPDLESDSEPDLSFPEPFHVLVDRANEFILSNPELTVNTCETVEFTTYDDAEQINLSSIYVYRGEGANLCVRGLRLWLKRCSRPPDAIPEQIGYYNIVPQLITSGNTEDDDEDFSDSELENLEAVTVRVNQLFRDEPVPGRIVTIETQPIKWGSKGPLPDQTTWTERGSASQTFIIMLRIFYILGKPTPHQIAFADFLPQLRPQEPDDEDYEMVLQTFPDVLARARQWLLSVPPNFHPVNVQTVTIRYSRKERIDTLNMTYTEARRHLTYVRYLRIGYLVEPEAGTASRSTVHLDCRLFMPRMHQEPEWFVAGVFEDALQVRERIDQWVICTGASVISVESIYMRISGGGESEYGFDAMQTWNETDTHSDRENERFACLYRVYTTESFIDPPGMAEDQALEQYTRSTRDSNDCIVL